MHTKIHSTIWAAALGALLAPAAQAQNHPITAPQRATAQQVAQQGVPLAELAPGAPDVYVVKRGDTLWGISGMYLRRPYRWPELWGMNLQAIPNPHLIFPGQTLYLDRQGGYARLRTSSATGEPDVVRLSPRTRSESLMDAALPTLKPHLIEPFLVEPVVVDGDELTRAPRIIATTEERVLITSGDRAYVRSQGGEPLSGSAGASRSFRIFRDATPLKDPVSGETLGYEAQYLGRAQLLHDEGVEESTDAKGRTVSEYIPATIEIKSVREEIRPGDRLLPMPERSYISYTPRVPPMEVDARVVSIYGGSRSSYAAQNQVVAINVGHEQGIESGHVLALRTRGERIRDKTDPERASVKLPSERNGLAMVFRTFDRVSYALILEVKNGVRVGDRLVQPD